jgi:hypothetical protein
LGKISDQFMPTLLLQLPIGSIVSVIAWVLESATPSGFDSLVLAWVIELVHKT